MKKIVLSIVISCLMILTASSQKDPAAGKLLDQFSEKALNAPSVTMSFDLTYSDAVEQTEETIKGSAVIREGVNTG